MSKKEKVYLINYDRNYEKRSEPAEILGIKKITNTSTLVYQIMFEDGTISYVPINAINENSDWHFVTLNDMLKYGSP